MELSKLDEFHDLVFLCKICESGVFSRSSSFGGEGSTQDVVQLIMTNSVLWHKSCRNAIEKPKSREAQTKKHEESISPVKTRRLSSDAESSTETSYTVYAIKIIQWACFVCGEVENKK